MSATTALVSYILITLVVEFPLIIIYLNMSGVFVACFLYFSFYECGVIFFHGHRRKEQKKLYSRKILCMDHKRVIIDQSKMVSLLRFLTFCVRKKQKYYWKIKCYINFRDTCQRFRRILLGPLCGITNFYRMSLFWFCVFNLIVPFFPS